MITSIARKTAPKLWASVSKIITVNGSSKFSTSAPRLAADDPSLMVGPFPRTQRERELAAKKYNLIPEDYVPFDEDEALGDYPNLKAIGAFNKNLYDDYDDPWDHRYHGEVMHINDDLYHYEKIDPLFEEKYQEYNSKEQWVIMFLVPVFVVAIIVGMQEGGIILNTPHKNRKYDPKGTEYFKFPSSGHH